MPRTITWITIALIVLSYRLDAALVINEFATNTSDDWVELALVSPLKESKDI